MKYYKLENEDGLIYIGVTKSKYLSQRLAVHKSQALTDRNIRKCASAELFKNGKKVSIELLEETNENDKTIELKYINQYNCVNKMKTGLDYKQTKKNWREKNPEYHNDYYHKTSYYSKQIECECGAIIKRFSLCNHKKSNIHYNNLMLLNSNDDI